jgi:hypothetical protein
MVSYRAAVIARRVRSCVLATGHDKLGQTIRSVSGQDANAPATISTTKSRNARTFAGGK